MRNRLFVLVTVVAIAFAAELARAEEPPRGNATPLLPAARSTGGSTLVGKHVAVDVGAIVELPSDTSDARPRAARDVALGGARFTELSGAGQEAPLLVPAPNTQIEGDLAAADSDTLTVRLLGHSQVVTVPRSAITSLQIWQRRSQAGKGFWIGAGVGAVAGLGLVIAGNAAHPCEGEDRGQCAAFESVAVGAFAIGGGVVGTVAGSMTHTDRWERVDTRRLSVAVMPDPRGGIRGRLAVRF